jgi:4-hydroxythreonine-4-phosphate dehydrogenase
VALVTTHIPINEVSGSLSVEKIYNKILAVEKSLKNDFGITRPKIAVLGLNPHAGENGKMGTEDLELILPAINKAKEENKVIAVGPFPADGFFGSSSMFQYDAVLAMYHDQGLIPFKAISFDEGVNFTAGLPVVRTSPDHGTGYDIAGKNMASANSFREALFTAINIVQRRKESAELISNPLKLSKFSKDRD